MKSPFRFFRWLWAKLRPVTCSHEFNLDDLGQTGIPIPPAPADNAPYEEHCRHLSSLNTHPSHTHRVRWPCRKCQKVFHAHCGIDIASHGRIVSSAME